MKRRIAWLPGDGIGREVMEGARLVLDRLEFAADYVHGEALDGTAVGAVATSGTGLHAEATTGTAVRAVSGSGTAALIDGHIELTEISVPLAPTGAARLFVRDPGTGKTQLCVKFPDNSLVVLASEA